MTTLELKQKKLNIYPKDKKMLTFDIDRNKASFHHRDLVSLYYFVIKNINLYLRKYVFEKVPQLKIKNALLVSNVIFKPESKRVNPEEVKEDEIENYYRVATIVINKKAFQLNLAMLFEIKKEIESFFERTDFQIRFYENGFKLFITKEKDKTVLQFVKKDSKEVIKVSKEQIKVLIRHLKEKMIYDWRLYNVRISDKFAILQTRRINTFILKISNKEFEIGRDVLIAISLSV